VAVKMELGEILIKSGILNLEQLTKAKDMGVKRNLGLETAIQKLGFATEEAITMAISKQSGVPYASRENKILRPEKDQNLDQTINEAFAREHLIVPLFEEDGMVAVTMADPNDMMLLDNLRLMTGQEIQPFISTKTQIIKAIDDFYAGSTSAIDKAMKSGMGGDGDMEVIEDDKLDLDAMTAAGKGEQVIQVVNAILKQAISEKCSDIHIEAYDEKVTLRFRINGTLYERTPPTKSAFTAVVSRIKILSNLDIAERRLPQDGAFSLKVQNRPIDMRVSICPTVFGEKVVMRILDKGAVNLNIDGLGLEPRQRDDLLKASQSPHGLIFMTGPTGSGKTTTLYTILNTIKTPEMNFMTIEDPVEFKLEGINQVQAKTSIGLTFASALRSFLRQDPDVILVGEVRDQETAEVCLRAALTGHLVISTLHTNSALEAVVRLADMGVEPFMLASSLRMLAAQRLIRVLCEKCKKAYKPSAELAQRCIKEGLLKPAPDPGQMVFYEEVGCETCHTTGFSGRKAIYEIFYITKNLRRAIGKNHDDLELLSKVAQEDGMYKMRTSGWRKVVEGITTVDEIMEATVGD